VLFQSYTQYIPLSVYDLQSWMGSPSIYVYDCSNGGIIIDSFKQFSVQRDNETEVRIRSTDNNFLPNCVICGRLVVKEWKLTPVASLFSV